MIRLGCLFCLTLFILVEAFPQDDRDLLKTMRVGNVTLDEAIRGGEDEERSHAGPWSSLLEDWAVGSTGYGRQERIVSLPPNTQGYYITNRVDAWSEDFPPKVANRPSQQQFNHGKQKPQGGGQYGPVPAQLQYGPTSGQQYGPTSNQQQQQQQQQQHSTNIANNNNNNKKEVTETDLYLLGAIEKLVYRVDFMEKRLRKAEELLYYLSAGVKKNPDPCPDKFVRAGANCYNFVTSKQSNWKTASSACKDLGATLAEMETIEENQDVVTYIQANAHLKGKDFWTGGLNPGLLWIWSNSARPVSNGDKSETQLLLGANSTASAQENPTKIRGSGRCLKLAYNPAIRSYSYMGHDCAAQQHFVCEKADKSISNAIQKISRSLEL